jgi:branched-subunit amino acid ABC-type transport system permease component
MDYLLIQILNSLVYGMLLFLLCAGLSLIFGLLGVVNLAHGSFFMLGGFFALSVIHYTGSFWWALLLAPLPVVAIAILVEMVLLRKIYRRSQLDQVLMTFGLSFVLTDLAESLWGKELFGINEPHALAHSVGFLGTVFPLYRLALLGFGALAAVLLWLVIERTRLGAMVRASVDDAKVAMGIGLRVPVLLTSTFAVGAWLAALAGVVAGPVLGVYSGIDVEVLIPAFIVVAIGGLGSLRGSFIGALIIGFADTFGKAYMPDAAMFLIYLAMIVILLVRPRGLFGLDPVRS